MWIPSSDSWSSAGIMQFSANAVFGFPMPTREAPLLVTPDYTISSWDGPYTLPEPHQLHEATVDFHHFRPLNDVWSFDGAVKVGIYADSESYWSADSFRVTGRALGIYQPSENHKWIFGAMVVNRANTSLLPAVGYIYA